MRLIDIKNEYFTAPAVSHPYHHNSSSELHKKVDHVPPTRRKHVPPHLRSDTGEIQFTEEDIWLLSLITEDEDTAASVISDSKDIPLEIQDVIYQLFRICHIVATYYEPATSTMESPSENGCISRTTCDSYHYPAGVLDKRAQEHYRYIYPEYAEKFLEDLNFAPNEIAVISRLATFIEEALRSLSDKNGGEGNEDH